MGMMGGAMTFFPVAIDGWDNTDAFGDDIGMDVMRSANGSKFLDNCGHIAVFVSAPAVGHGGLPSSDGWEVVGPWCGEVQKPG